tara:strand:+ start:6083 stop:7402 length:1320 start_codon:yes stop_codon:yes gene_type:complete
MEKLSINNKNKLFVAKINRYMFVILLLMVACFFTWSENIVITRLIKVVGRLGVLFASYLVYNKIIKYGALGSLKWHNTMSPLMYVGYILLGFMSIIWSSSRGYSLLQWLMTVETLFFAYFFIKSLYLLDQFFFKHPVRLYNLLGNVAVVLMLIFIIGEFVAPDSFTRLTHGGEEQRMGGYMMNPNELGMLAGIGIAGLVFDFYRSHKVVATTIKLLILFYAIYASGSRSSFIGAVLIIMFHISQTSNKKLKLGIAILVLLVMPVAVNKMIFKDGDTTRVEEVMSMTGRLPFWKALITEGLPQKPMLGYGFMRIANEDYFQGRHTYPGKMTHNTFMQVLMNLGFVGLTVVIFQVFYTLRAIFAENKEKKLMLLSFLIPLIINSLTEFGIFGESNYGILFYQLIILYISFQPNEIISPMERVYLAKRRPELTSIHKIQVSN